MAKVTVSEAPDGMPAVIQVGDLVTIYGQRYMVQSRSYGGTRQQLRRLHWYENAGYWLKGAWTRAATWVQGFRR